MAAGRLQFELLSLTRRFGDAVVTTLSYYKRPFIRTRFGSHI